MHNAECTVVFGRASNAPPLAFVDLLWYHIPATQMNKNVSERECVFTMVKTHSPLCIPFRNGKVICVATNGAVRFSVCSSVWGCTLFYFTKEGYYGRI